MFIVYHHRFSDKIIHYRVITYHPILMLWIVNSNWIINSVSIIICDVPGAYLKKHAVSINLKSMFSLI